MVGSGMAVKVWHDLVCSGGVRLGGWGGVRSGVACRSCSGGTRSVAAWLGGLQLV